MRKVVADKIEDGMILARDVCATSGNVLLGKGTRLSSSMGRRLKNWGIESVHVEGEEESKTEILEKSVSPEEIKAQLRDKFSDVNDNPIMQKIFNDVVNYKISKGIS